MRKIAMLLILLATFAAMAPACLTPCPPPPDDGAPPADLCISSLTPEGKPCCVDPQKGRCP